MSHFTIVPADVARPQATIDAPDPGQVLHIVQKLDCGEADIFRDGEYFFSVSLQSGGLWSIYQRTPRVAGDGFNGGIQVPAVQPRPMH